MSWSEARAERGRAGGGGSAGPRGASPDAAAFGPLGWGEAAFRRAGDAAARGLDGLRGRARGDAVLLMAEAAGLRAGAPGLDADGGRLLVRMEADGTFSCDLGPPGREAAFRAAVGLAHRELHWRGGVRWAALASPGEGAALRARWEARWFAEGLVGSEEAVAASAAGEPGDAAAAARLCWLTERRFGDAARFWGARHAGVPANDP